MESWQVALILLASIITGVVVGTPVGYLILRFLKKRKITYMVQQIMRSAEEQANSILESQGEQVVPQFAQSQPEMVETTGSVTLRRIQDGGTQY